MHPLLLSCGVVLFEVEDARAERRAAGRVPRVVDAAATQMRAGRQPDGDDAAGPPPFGPR